MKKLKVDVRLGHRMDAQKIRDQAPDAVVVSTGSSPKAWELAESSRGHRNVLNIWEALEDPEKILGRVLIVDDTRCDWETCSVVEFVSGRGNEVEVVTTSVFVGSGLILHSLATFLSNTSKRGVVFSPMERITELSDGRVTAVNNFSQKERYIKDIDTIIYNVGRRAEDFLFRSLKKDIPEVYCIGDAYAPRWVDRAIRDGELVGRGL